MTVSSRQPATDHEMIHQTLARLAQSTDAGDYDDWAALFTPDATLRMLGQSWTGRAALRAFIEADQPPARRGLHLTTDSVIALYDDRAEVRSNFIFISPGADASVVVAGGWYEDVLVPADGRWLVSTRAVTLYGPVASQPWGMPAR